MGLIRRIRDKIDDMIVTYNEEYLEATEEVNKKINDRMDTIPSPVGDDTSIGTPPGDKYETVAPNSQSLNLSVIEKTITQYGEFEGEDS